MSTNASSADVPAFIGFVDTTVHALRLIHAARQGVIPRITRRLNDSERRTMIKSGAVFVFSVEESGIKRWTDGLLWSPSRIVGNFLVSPRFRAHLWRLGHSPEAPSRGIGGQSEMMAGYKSSSANDQGTFKPGGLIKKTITVTVEGSDLHLISYYTSDDIRLGRLCKPTSRRDIMALPMPPHIFRLTNFRTPPKVEIGPDGKARLVCEGEENDTADVKIEESSFHVGHSPTWSPTQSSPVEPPYPSNNSLYNLNHHSAADYPRHSSSERWGSIDPLRLPGPAAIAWGGLSNTHVGQDSRRDHSASTDSSWAPLNTTGGRWEGTGYEASTSAAGGAMYIDRTTRPRTNTYPNLITSGRAGDDHNRSYGTYHSGSSGLSRSHHSSYSSSHASAPRVTSSWMSNTDPTSRASSRTPHPHSATSATFDSSSSSHFTNHGYHAASHSYGSSWSPADGVSLDLPSSQSPFSPQPGLHSYDQYGSGSGTLPSPEEYATKVEEL